jgi:hypothetical protein
VVRIRVVVLVGALSAGLAAAPVVSADEPAQTFNTDECVTETVEGHTVTTCFDGHGVSHETETPSGVVNVIEHSDVVSSVTVDGVVVESLDSNNHFHELVIDGESQESHQRLHERTVTIVVVEGVTLRVECGVDIVVHVANGQTQFDRSGQGCTAGPV